MAHAATLRFSTLGSTISPMRRFARFLPAVSLMILPCVCAPSAEGGQVNGTRPASVLVNGVYRNSTFGFSYKPPFGWVDRTADMQEDARSQPKETGAQVLLAMFERPPEARGETVNSAVIIATESVKSYPGLKTAADYFGPLEEVTKAKGFEVSNEPYEFAVGGRNVAREDFSKNLGQLSMKQSTLVMLQKGLVISFTFLGGSDDEVDQLIQGVNFRPSQVSATTSSSRQKK